MAVRVDIYDQKSQHIENGKSFRVLDDILYVYDSAGNIISLYARLRWNAATVEDLL